MRATSLVSLLLPVVLATGGCAASRTPQPIDPHPSDRTGAVPNEAERIPLYAERRLPGCEHRPAGQLAAGTLLGLQDQAHQKQADAVVEVRQRVRATEPPRNQRSTSLRPAATVYYTGTAVRFENPGCRVAPAPEDAPAAAS